MISEIKPKYIDGEPMCGALEYGIFDCGARYCKYYLAKPVDNPCIPALRRDRDEAMKALHSLTPGGSEFYNDIKACVDYVVKLKTRQHETIKRQVGQRKAAERDLDEVRRELCKHRAAYSPACQVNRKSISEIGRIIAEQREWKCFDTDAEMRVSILKEAIQKERKSSTDAEKPNDSMLHDTDTDTDTDIDLVFIPPGVRVLGKDILDAVRDCVTLDEFREALEKVVKKASETGKAK